jgi:hypothetical protein
MRFATFLTLIGALALAACGEPVDPLEEKPEVEAADSAFTIAHGKASPIEDTLRLVLHDSTALHAFMEQYGLADEAEAWRTDFEQQSVVVVTMGARPNHGFDICVDSIRPAADGTTVHVTRAEGSFGALAETTPWHVVRTRTKEGPYVFSETVLAEAAWCQRPGSEEP